MLVDTHAHLFDESFSNDLGQVIDTARDTGIERVVVPAVDASSAEHAIKLSENYPEFISVGVGVHPEYLTGEGDWRKEIEKIEGLIERDEVVAIGEIGLDYSTPELEGNRENQGEVFAFQCRMAKEAGKPVIIHTRGTVREAIEVIDSIGNLAGVFHCFSGNEEDLRLVIERGFYVSFCGNITWSKRVRSLVSTVPTDRILFETDSPYMTPRDKQGEVMGGSLRNTPASVRILAQIQAEIREVPLDELASKVRENTRELFDI